MTPKSFKISAAATEREKCVLEMLALQFLTSRTLEAEIKIRFHQNIPILSLENILLDKQPILEKPLHILKWWLRSKGLAKLMNTFSLIEFVPIRFKSTKGCDGG